MTYRNLGRTGVKVSPLCLGCMMFGRKTEAAESYGMIDRAIDAGINFIDTADAYGRGKSEEIVGEALQRNGHRDRMILATKVHKQMDASDPNSGGNSARHIIAGCEASLRRLRTDHIDLYQIHRPQSDIPVDEILRAMDHLVRAGKIRYAGTSTFAAWQLMESVMISRELGLARFVCEQPPYNLLDRRAERELLPFAQTYGFGLIPWSPLAGGLLTGKYRKGQPLPEGSRFETTEGSQPSRRMTPAFWDAIEKFATFCEEKNQPPSVVALAWCMDRPGITSPILGPRTLAQLEDNLAALHCKLDGDDHAALDQIFPPGEMLSPFYLADFGPHRFR